MRHIVVLLLGLVFATNIGCDAFRKNSEVSKITIQLPDYKPTSKVLSKIATLNVGNSQWASGAPSLLSDVDCYAVYVHGSNMAAGSCSNSAGATVIPVSQVVGTFKAGQSISLEIPSGSDRTIGVFAIKSTHGICEDSFTDLFKASNYMAPLGVGSVKVNLTPGENTVTIPVQLENSVAVESCNTDRGTWPACSVKVGKISYDGGGFTVSGSCLNQTKDVSIRNESTGAVFPLSLESQAASQLFGRMTSQFSMQAGQIYSLVINQANAQVVTPLNLDFSENSYKLNNAGTYIGEIEKLRLNSMMTYNLATGLNSGLQYYHYGNTSYLFSSIFIRASMLSAIPLRDIILENSAEALSTFYFTGTNCTGNLIVPTSLSSNEILGDIFPVPTGCSGGVCTGIAYNKLGPNKTFQASIAQQSYVQTSMYADSPDSNQIICQPSSGTVDGFVFPVGEITPASPPNQVLSNISITK